MTTEPRTLTLSLPLPPQELHPNGRPGHYQKRARLVAKYRADVHTRALEQLGTRRPRLEHATISLRFVTASGRDMDTDGLISWIKPLVDTLCSRSGVKDPTPRLWLLPGDGPQFVTWGEVTLEKGLPERVEITLSEWEER